MTDTRQIRGELRTAESMARHSSWRVGGPAKQYFTPADVEDLSEFLCSLAPDEPLLWVGLGSNLLVRDGGWSGTVIATHKVLGGLRRPDSKNDPGLVHTGAGVACAKLARQCVKWGLGPAEFFAGIPGTVGGALAMNAGAFGGETWDHVEKVEVIDRSGRVSERLREEFEVGYREVTAPDEAWFLSAYLRFEPRANVQQDDIRNLLARRKASQPIGEPSCGSVFRNPPKDHAARLIEASGLKGHRIGGAWVSEKHANFIITDRSASARDIEVLIDHVRERVVEDHGTELIPEVRIVGDAP
ncbi:MAG: UDP-N-acetylmuramate dehydrogenase [Gammaproteobacteria bacterium]|nr:UDP-N-acetylmuramate dehydrogenase [Gammaproteobacteria bacterium]